MADNTKTENKDYYWQMYADVWAFHKKYINGVCDSDEFWEQVVDESNQIAKKHKENKFIVGLILNEIDEMERHRPDKARTGQRADSDRHSGFNGRISGRSAGDTRIYARGSQFRHSYIR